jgi:hypothetical protein
MPNDAEKMAIIRQWLLVPWEPGRSSGEAEVLELLAKLSRLEQSRVERAVAYLKARIPFHPPGSAEERERYHVETLNAALAILTAQDSSAGSPVPVTGSVSAVPPEAQAGAQPVAEDPSSAGEPGGRSSPPPAEVKPSADSEALAAIRSAADIQLAIERQRFLDEAAMRLAGSCLDQQANLDAALAYTMAESLWTERQKRIDEQHARGRK